MKKIFVIALLIVVSAFTSVSQETATPESTPEATSAPTEVFTATLEPTLENVVVIEDGEVVGGEVEVITPVENETVVNVWVLVMAAGTILITGFSGGVLTAAYFIRNLKNNPEAISALEILFTKLSPERRAAMFEFLLAVDDVVEIGKEVLDDTPASEK